MTKHLLALALCFGLCLTAKNLLAQKKFTESKPSAETTNCRVITLKCQCTNPKRNFVVENQRVGKVNPGDPGICQSAIYIDEWLQRNTYTACVRGGQQGFDPTKPPACTATWSCKVPCAP